MVFTARLAISKPRHFGVCNARNYSSVTEEKKRYLKLPDLLLLVNWESSDQCYGINKWYERCVVTHISYITSCPIIFRRDKIIKSNVLFVHLLGLTVWVYTYSTFLPVILIFKRNNGYLPILTVWFICHLLETHDGSLWLCFK